jgi:hypothetical protein
MRAGFDADQSVNHKFRERMAVSKQEETLFDV